MKSKNTIYEMVKTLLRLGYVVQAKELMKSTEEIRKNLVQEKVVSLDEYRKLRDLDP